MHLEITAPATCIESDRDSSAYVTLQGEITKEIDVEMPNPNLDYYLVYDEWIGDHSRVTIDGREWELDLGEAEIVLELTVKELRESAQMRADEDFTQELSILESWQSGGRRRDLEHVFDNAINEALIGEPTPSAEQGAR